MQALENLARSDQLIREPTSVDLIELASSLRDRVRAWLSANRPDLLQNKD